MAHYDIPGTIEMGSRPNAELQDGDTITDNNGRGRTVYVKECALCGRMILAGVRILEPYECAGCDPALNEEPGWMKKLKKRKR